MASSNKDVTNFFPSLASVDIKTVVAPMSTSSWPMASNDYQEDGVETAEDIRKKEAAEEAKRLNLNYVQEHVEKERARIQKLNIDAANKSNPQNTDFAKRDYNRGRGGWHRGRGRGRGIGRGQRPTEGRDSRIRHDADSRTLSNQAGDSSSVYTGISVYGTIPDARLSDECVFMKYDFNRRRFDTSSLVINRSKEDILEGLKKHQIIMIEGFTGCGKTTQVPQFILNETVASKGSCRIAVTQPRRIAAISVANRVAAEREWAMGGIIGFQIGMARSTSEDTRLTYMTTGVLLQLLIGRKSLSEWTHIIIDEVHERDLETDLLLLVIKKLMVDTYNTTTRIILMSATLNPEKFNDYFPKWKNSELQEEPITIKVDLPNQFPIVEFYLEDAAKIAGHESFNMNGLEEAKVHSELFEIAAAVIESFELNERMQQNGHRGAVLVFLPGLLEIETFFKVLNEVVSNREKQTRDNDVIVPKWQILPLHSSITNDEQQRVFHTAWSGYRKIILATNIAESSITVPDVKYVIDFCLTKNLSCDPTTNYTCLRLDWASKNQCIQRRGRCGRVSSGTVYRMVTKKFYATFEQDACPEMLRSSLENVVLEVKLLDMGSPSSILALSVDPPEQNKIKTAVANLKEIGALTIVMENEKYDAFDGKLTFVGRVLARLPIDIRLGRLILLGHTFDCLEETVIIAAGLSVKSPFAFPYSKRMEAYLSKQIWAKDTFSDCLALLNLYVGWFKRHEDKEFHTYSEEKNWARQYFAQLSSLREMRAIIEELYRRLRMSGIETLPNRSGRTTEEQYLILKVVIAGAFYPNYFIRPRPNEKDYSKEIAKDLISSDPFTSVVFQGFPMEQPGELYSKIISDAVIFRNCIPQFYYNGSKVVVTFDSRGNFIGPISSAVYRSIKLRQLRRSINFSTPSREDAYKLVKELKKNQKRIKVHKTPDQVRMPGLVTQEVLAHITSGDASTPENFYVILNENIEESARLSSQLDRIHFSLKPLDQQLLCQPGQFCIANIKGINRRVRIDAEKDNMYFVYSVDLGLSHWIKPNMIFKFSDELREANLDKIPALAIRCRLSEVKPAVRAGGIWSREAIYSFNGYLKKHGGCVKIKIFSIVDGVIAGELNNLVDDISVNEMLLICKFADKSNESPKSIENHNIRTCLLDENQFSTESLPSFYKEREDCQNKRYDPETMLVEGASKIKDHEFRNEAVLRGPHSPLEMHFTSMCNTANYKQTIIDSSSLNSVALDHDPYNPISRLLVSASVAIAHRSGCILARETTLLPAIPGMCGLLTMIFCPKLEFRVDRNYSKYTGCIAGLGVDGNEERIYGDHDMEVVFDTVIDEDDVNMINSLRSSMNTLLSEDSLGYNTANHRDRMRQEVLKLLEKERPSMDETWSDSMYHWNLLDKSKVKLRTSKRDIVASVFPLHAEVNLVSEEDEFRNN